MNNEEVTKGDIAKNQLLGNTILAGGAGTVLSPRIMSLLPKKSGRITFPATSSNYVKSMKPKTAITLGTLAILGGLAKKFVDAKKLQTERGHEYNAIGRAIGQVASGPLFERKVGSELANRARREVGFNDVALSAVNKDKSIEKEYVDSISNIKDIPGRKQHDAAFNAARVGLIAAAVANPDFINNINTSRRSHMGIRLNNAYGNKLRQLDKIRDIASIENDKAFEISERERESFRNKLKGLE